MPYLPERYSEPDPESYQCETYEIAPAFPGMSLRDFMRQTSVYENRPAPFSPSLRRAAWTGMAMTLFVALAILLLPRFEGEVRSLFFPMLPTWFNGYLARYLHWLAYSPWLGFVDGFLLTSGVGLLILTRNLQRGIHAQQWLAFVQAMGGALNLVLIIAALVMIVANLLAWLLLMLLIIGLFCALVRLLVALL